MLGLGIRQGARRRVGRLPGMPAATAMALGDRVVTAGDSMTYGQSDVPAAYQPWLILAASGRFDYPATLNRGSTVNTVPPTGGNMGVNGQRTAQYVERKAAIASAAAGGALILGGIENDLTAGIAVATSIANLDEIIAACADAKRIYVTPVAPTKTVVGNPANQAKKASFDAYFAAHTNPRVRFLPGTWNGVTLALDGTIAGAHSFDGIHQNPLGAKVQGANMWSDMASDWPAGSAYTDPKLGTSELLGSAGDFVGTGGTANGMGQVATGWVLTNTTGAGVAASVVDGLVDGQRGQRLILSGTASANARVKLRRTIASAFVAGDRLFGFGRVRVGNTAATGPAQGLRGLGISAASTQARWLAETYAGAQGALDPAAQFSGIFRLFPAVASASGGSWTIDLDIQPQTGVPIDIAIDLAAVRAYQFAA